MPIKNVTKEVIVVEENTYDIFKDPYSYSIFFGSMADYLFNLFYYASKFVSWR